MLLLCISILYMHRDQLPIIPYWNRNVMVVNLLYCSVHLYIMLADISSIYVYRYTIIIIIIKIQYNIYHIVTRVLYRGCYLPPDISTPIMYRCVSCHSDFCSTHPLQWTILLINIYVRVL